MLTTRTREQEAVTTLVGALASAATALIVITADTAWEAVRSDVVSFASFATLAVVLHLVSVEVYGRGAISVGGIGLLAVGFMWGVGPAMIVAVTCAFIHALRKRSMLQRIAFNLATLALAAGAATALYHALTPADASTAAALLPALAASAAYLVVNVSLVVLAMSLDEGGSIANIWRERFRWASGHFLSFGPLALATTAAYDKMGLTGLLAFSLPPALVIFSVQQYVRRTSVAVEEVRCANAELAARNEDLRLLFDFAGGLAARAHDRGELVHYVERALDRLVGGRARIADAAEAGGIELVAGGAPVGSLRFEDEGDFDRRQWERLREAILPQLATALEGAELVERVKKTHLDTIAALSRSMEAKDYYTGGHTERVAEVAVALAKRLGFDGPELHAIEVGALLHDIGKIGIPERILHKPGPLDAEEWKVMKDHPVISDTILSEIELDPIVRQIARSSHERIDGDGYPDALAGDSIPLPARIVLVADAWDALTTDRPYRRARNVEAALEELRVHTGTQFCPQVMAALEAVYSEEPHVLGGGSLLELKIA